MSKYFIPAIPAFLLILQLLNNCHGQSARAVITIVSGPRPVAMVRGSYDPSTPKRNLALLDHYYGIGGLADRISDIGLEDSTLQPVAFRRLTSGEFLADREFLTWRYKLNLAPLPAPSAAGHVSWMGNGHGLLFLTDLLPMGIVRSGRPVQITLELPDGWTSSAGRPNFDVADIDRSTVFVAKTTRLLRFEQSGARVNIFTTAVWKFSDDEVRDFTHEIFSAYASEFGLPLVRDIDVVIVPFPQTVAPGAWEGDSRGNSIVIVSSDMPFRTQSVQRLHEQLRHELFHLWFPNSLTLSGNYDWFYEGFALYRSLKLGVGLNRLRFDDYLDTLGRALTIDSALGPLSLLDASARRSSGSDTSVYARGMLAAFLTDIQLLDRSAGREDVSSLLRKIRERYSAPTAETDASAALLKVIGLPGVTGYVSNGDRIDWIMELRAAGIEVIDRKPGVALRVVNKPTSSQKKLLDKLGYNNWRKLSRAQK